MCIVLQNIDLKSVRKRNFLCNFFEEKPLGQADAILEFLKFEVDWNFFVELEFVGQWFPPSNFVITYYNPSSLLRAAVRMSCSILVTRKKSFIFVCGSFGPKLKKAFGGIDWSSRLSNSNFSVIERSVQMVRVIGFSVLGLGLRILFWKSLRLVNNKMVAGEFKINKL